MHERAQALVGRAARALAAASTCVLPAFASASEPEGIFHAEPSKRWGTPRKVLPPQYPREALEKRHTGYVDMEGVVTPFTTLRALTFMPDTDASRVFIEPREGLQAYVYGRMVVNAAGDVVETSAYAYPEGNDRRHFVRATESALRQLKYPPSEREQRIVCMEIIYNLRD